MSIRLLPSLAFMLALLAVPGHAPAAEDAPAILVVDAAQARLLGIRTAPATAATGIPLEHLAGRLEPALDASAVVTAPYAGMVVRVLAAEGSEVQAGAALAIVQSRAVLDLASEAARRASEAALARSQARRDADLHAEGIVAAARAEASRAAAVQADAATAQARDALALAPRADAAGAGSYELRAPLAGRVLERKVVPGQALEALAPAFVVADTRELEVAIRVPAMLVRQVAIGTPATVEGSSGRGRVVAVGAAVEAASQTVPVRARVAGDPGLLAGQPVSVRLEVPAPAGSLALPRAALARLDGVPTIFVAAEGGFRPVVVEVLAESPDGVIVSGGPAPGTPVAVAGSSALKTIARTAD